MRQQGAISGRPRARTGIAAREERAAATPRNVWRRNSITARQRFANSCEPLSLQSRTAPTVEAAAQLTIAAERVAAFGRVHRRLHLLDHQKSVEFKQYLRHLCRRPCGPVVSAGSGARRGGDGHECQIADCACHPARLHRERADYQFLEVRQRRHHRSNGKVGYRAFALGIGQRAGLPAKFGPGSKGLGMKIIQSLVKQIGGTLQVASGEGDRGTRVTVALELPLALNC